MYLKNRKIQKVLFVTSVSFLNKNRIFICTNGTTEHVCKYKHELDVSSNSTE